MENEQFKVNNDILIPRSILKRHIGEGTVKTKRLEEAAMEFFEYQKEMEVHELMRTDSE